jgi:hypothetical protein
MNNSSSTDAAPRSHRARNWFLIIMAAALAVAAVEAASIFFLSKEARKLHLAIDTHLEGPASTKIQFTVGPGLLGIGRMAAHWVDDIPDEVHHALGAVKEASVGIYELDVNPSAAARSQLVQITDERLGLKGWQRIVAVSENRDTVLVYAPKDIGESDDIQFCVAVCDRKDLIVVSATASLKGLMKLTDLHRGELHEFLRTPQSKVA